MTAGEKYNHGRNAESAGRADLAEKFYLEALKIDPGFLPALNNLGALYARSGKNDMALTIFRRALEIQADEKILFNIGSVLFRMGNLQESESYLKKALKLQPRLLKAHLLMAYLLEKAGHVDRSLLYLQNAFRIEPSNRMASLSLALGLQDAGRNEEALAVAEKYLSFRAGDESMRNLRAEILLKLNRFDESLAELENLTQSSKGYTGFTEHLKEAKEENVVFFKNVQGKIGSRTQKLREKMERKKAALHEGKSSPGSQGDVQSDLKDLVDLSLLHLFSGDPQKAMRFLVQAKKIKARQDEGKKTP